MLQYYDYVNQYTCGSGANKHASLVVCFLNIQKYESSYSTWFTVGDGVD
jgi:hypothetical protein